MVDARDSSPEEGEETDPILLLAETKAGGHSSLPTKVSPVTAASAVPTVRLSPERRPIVLPRSESALTQQPPAIGRIELNRSRAARESGGATRSRATDELSKSTEESKMQMSTSSSSPPRSQSSRISREKERRAQLVALETEEDNEQDRLEALQQSAGRKRVNITASTSDVPPIIHPARRPSATTPRRDRSRSPPAHPSSQRSWQDERGAERERSYHRDDSYRDDLYRDGPYRESGYRDDHYRENLYRDHPYRDDAYRDERHRGDRADGWTRSYRSPRRSITPPRYERDRYAPPYPDRHYMHSRSGAHYEDHDDYERGRYYDYPADYDDPRGPRGKRREEALRDDNLQLFYGDDAAISGPLNGSAHGSGGRDRDRDLQWQHHLSTSAPAPSNGARDLHGIPPSRSSSSVNAQNATPGAVSLRRLQSHSSHSRSPSPPAKTLKRKSSPLPIRTMSIERDSRERSIDTQLRTDTTSGLERPPPPPRISPPRPPPPPTSTTLSQSRGTTPTGPSKPSICWPSQYSAKSGYNKNSNGRAGVSSWSSVGKSNPLGDDEDMDMDVDPSGSDNHCSGGPQPLPPTGPAGVPHYSGPPPDVAYAKAPPPYSAPPPVPNALPIPPAIPRSFTTASTAAAVQTARRARLRAHAVALEAAIATGAVSAGIGISARDHASLKNGAQLRRERPSRVPLTQRVFWGCSSISDYEVTVKLGQGTFGEVKMGKHKKTGIEVALKKVTIHEEKDGLPITAIREVKLLKRLDHPSIIPVLDMAYRPSSEPKKLGDVFMVEPYMDHDLNGMLENAAILFQPTQIKLYMKQLLEGTLYMHKNNILHRDMKAANLLINNSGQLQIADFGLARAYHDPGTAWKDKGWKGGAYNYTAMVVTRWYRPPELLAGERKYGPPIDIWGLGCILAEMVNRKPIFKGQSEIDQMRLISELCGSPSDANYAGWSQLIGVKDADPTGRPDPNPEVPGQHDFGNHSRRVIQHFTNPNGLQIPGKCADLIDRMLVLDPRQRITAAEALDHEFFWTKPFPADPASLPKYQPSKEIDRQRREAARAPPHIPAPNYGLASHFQQHQQQQQHQHQQQFKHPPPQHHQHPQQPLYNGPPPPMAPRAGGPPPLPRNVAAPPMGGPRVGSSYPPLAGGDRYGGSRLSGVLPARPAFQAASGQQPPTGPPVPLGLPNPNPASAPPQPTWSRDNLMYRSNR